MSGATDKPKQTEMCIQTDDLPWEESMKEKLKKKDNDEKDGKDTWRKRVPRNLNGS